MPLTNLMRPGTRGAVARADVVAQVSVVSAGGRAPRTPAGHSGIAAEAQPTHGHGDELAVFHMGNWIEKQLWRDASRGAPSRSDLEPTDCCADVLAAQDGLEESERDAVIAEALRLFARAPTSTRPRGTCYYQGPADPARHPRYPAATNRYAFSCVTFVLHCYETAQRPILDKDSLPHISPVERAAWLRLLGDPALIYSGPFRRAACGHLLGALSQRSPELPYRGGAWGWARFSDGVLFAQLIAGTAPRPHGCTTLARRQRARLAPRPPR